jgi:imidazolonepropionase-like amidohydrolase
LNRLQLRNHLALALLALAFSACTPTETAPEPTAQAAVTVLQNFTLIDGSGGAAAPDSALIIGEDGRISWVGPMAELQVPEGAATVDLAGKFVLPGLIDGHVHLGLVQNQAQKAEFYSRESVEADLKTYTAYGVTGVAVYGTDEDLIYDITKEQRAGRPTMARVFTAGKGIVYKGGYGGTLGVNVPVATDAEAVAAVEDAAAKGADFIKMWVDDERGMIPVKMPYSMTKAVIDAAHRNNVKAVAHVYYLADAKELVRQGVDGFGHAVRDQPVDQELLELMKEHGTWRFASTLSREMAYSFAVMPWLQDPFFTRGVSQGTLDVLRGPAREKAVVLGETQVAGLPYKAKLFPDFGRAVAQALENFKAEADAGVLYGMGTDSGPPARFPGFNMHEEMQLYVMAGLTPMQAIVAATSSNAQFLSAEDLGTVTAGKWADLLVINADPLADIRNTQMIDSVYVAGQSAPTVWQICTPGDESQCAGDATTAPIMPY